MPPPAVTPGVFPPASTEIVGDRTADSDTYQGPGGSKIVVDRVGMNYQPSPGAAFQPVNLAFHVSGTAMVEDGSQVIVKVSADDIDATDRTTGVGLRWIVPSLPSVAGSVASVAIGGVTWNFSPNGRGDSLSAVVSSRQGPKTYQFQYALLGGAGPLSVDAQGDLVGNGVTVTRPSVVTAAGQSMPTGGWQLLSGGIAQFSFNDSSIASFPYVIDPAVQTSGYASAGQSYAVSGPGYPPSGGVVTYPGNDWVGASDGNTGGGSSGVADFALQFPISSIPGVPSVAVATAGFMADGICLDTAGPLDANEEFYANWVTAEGSAQGSTPPVA